MSPIDRLAARLTPGAPRLLAGIALVALGLLGIWWGSVDALTAEFAIGGFPLNVTLQVVGALVLGGGLYLTLAGRPRLGGALVLAGLAVPWLLMYAFNVYGYRSGQLPDHIPVGLTVWGSLVLAGGLILILHPRVRRATTHSAAADADDDTTHDAVDHPDIDVTWKATDGGPLAWRPGEAASIRARATGKGGRPAAGQLQIKGTVGDTAETSTVDLKDGAAAIDIEMPDAPVTLQWSLVDSGQVLETGTLDIPIADYREWSAREFETAVRLARPKMSLGKSATPRDLTMGIEEGDFEETDLLDKWEAVIPTLEQANWGEGANITRDDVRAVAEARRALARALGEDADSDELPPEPETKAAPAITAPSAAARPAVAPTFTGNRGLAAASGLVAIVAAVLPFGAAIRLPLAVAIVILAVLTLKRK